MNRLLTSCVLALILAALPAIALAVERPSQLSCGPYGEAIRVSWLAQDDVDEYKIKRSDLGAGNQGPGDAWGAFYPIAAHLDGSSSEYVDATAAQGQTYRYKVVAFDEDGRDYSSQEFCGATWGL